MNEDKLRHIKQSMMQKAEDLMNLADRLSLDPNSPRLTRWEQTLVKETQWSIVKESLNEFGFRFMNENDFNPKEEIPRYFDILDFS